MITYNFILFHSLTIIVSWQYVFFFFNYCHYYLFFVVNQFVDRKFLMVYHRNIMFSTIIRHQQKDGFSIWLIWLVAVFYTIMHLVFLVMHNMIFKLSVRWIYPQHSTVFYFTVFFSWYPVRSKLTDSSSVHVKWIHNILLLRIISKASLLSLSFSLSVRYFNAYRKIENTNVWTRPFFSLLY